MNPIHKSIDLGNGKSISIETGRLAKQSDGSVVLRCEDTMLLATVVARKEIKPDVDFLPLSVDYMEKYSSTGKFPGGFFKRDGRLGENEILVSRLVDRALRPLFPSDYHADVQVMIQLISSDKENQSDAFACVAASAALMVSDIPFEEPVSEVRVVRKGSQFLINPTVTEMVGSDLDIIVAATASSVVMVEGEMKEVSEEVMLEGIQVGFEACKKLNNFQLEFRAAVNKTTRTYPHDLIDAELFEKVKGHTQKALENLAQQSSAKEERSAEYKRIREELVAGLLLENPTFSDKLKEVDTYLHDLYQEIVRNFILSHNVRLDGRKTDEVRSIWCEVGYLPRAHGSAIFTRGETQSLTTVTLGSKLDEQTIDSATTVGSKRFMLQYNFPGFSTGEVKPNRAPGRREIGHGNLAERALKMVVPSDTEHTIRIVSDILESNGSSSMATVCAGTLALMDAGVKITGPVSGIAMGLILDESTGKFAILSDILGDEDHLGDMDFKVAGTEKGLTACQMDIKVRGLSFEILGKALEQSKAGRLHILHEMTKTLATSREELSPYAPRIIKMIIPSDMIGAVIGPGGKIIQEIQRTTGTTISIEEVDNKGVVTISSPDAESLQAGFRSVKAIVAQPEVGEVYTAKVKSIKEFGAFVEFLPGKEGLLHISEISHQRLKSMEGVLEIGEEFPIKIIGVDEKTGKFRLSRKVLLPKPEIAEN
jgi:polyribonucleotide nucleotidyltransferase